MFFDVIGQCIERTFDPCTITLIDGCHAEPREIRASKSVRREQAVQTAALHAAISGGRALRRTIDKGKGARAVASLGAADVDFIGLDRLPGFGMLSLDARQ